jgi:hypothetical protein
MNQAQTSNVASSATVVTLAAANTARKMITIYNDSTATLYLKMGSGATSTSYTVEVEASGYYEMSGYTGIYTGLWSSASGYARVTEVV